MAEPERELINLGYGIRLVASVWFIIVLRAMVVIADEWHWHRQWNRRTAAYNVTVR